MMMTQSRFLRRLKKHSGQSLVEYSLILALIAVVAILTLKGLGRKVQQHALVHQREPALDRSSRSLRSGALEDKPQHPNSVYR